MPNQNQTLQYFCSNCNSLLKSVAAELDVETTEACQHCGHSLSQTLEVHRPAAKKEPLPQFQVAVAAPALTFDIKSLDDFFLALRPGDALFVAGRRVSLVASRLCVRALLSKRRGGLDSPVVLVIDAGNNSDVYQCVNFARQYGLSIAKTLGGIVVSRAFTIYQLARLLIHELSVAVRRFNPKLVVISGLLAMFAQDPQVDQDEARGLLRQMMAAIKKIGHVLFVVTADDTRGYEEIVSRFDNRMEIREEAGKIRVAASTAYRSKGFALPFRALELASR